MTVIVGFVQDFQTALGGAVIKYIVSDDDYNTLTKIVFTSATQPDWQEAVRKGRTGVLDESPLPTDVAEGPMLKNWRMMTSDPASARFALGFGQQTVWLTAQAITILQKVKPIILGPH